MNAPRLPGVHPNAQGAEKMADRWFAALTPILKKQP
jgi:lysophospholipase L1-like esterase